MSATYTVLVTRTAGTGIVTSIREFSEEGNATYHYEQMSEEKWSGRSDILSIDSYVTETKVWIPEVR